MTAQTIHLSTELRAPADRVWSAMLHPAAFTYVVRGIFGVPALAGRTDPFRPGEVGTGWLFLFHVIPFSRHTVRLEEVDEPTRTMRSREHGGMVRAWNHMLHVEPLGEGHCRYSDTVEIDAGRLTGVVARLAIGIYRYRHRRWQRMAKRHLQPITPGA